MGDGLIQIKASPILVLLVINYFQLCILLHSLCNVLTCTMTGGQLETHCSREGRFDLLMVDFPTSQMIKGVMARVGYGGSVILI